MKMVVLENLTKRMHTLICLPKAVLLDKQLYADSQQNIIFVFMESECLLNVLQIKSEWVAVMRSQQVFRLGL